MELTMGSLFAGIGGFEEAGRRNGIKTLRNCEIDSFKRQILKKNFPDAIQYADIRDVHTPPHVDILTGGFPCQDLAQGNTHGKGPKNIQGERSGLWREYARLLGEVGPGCIIFENSPNLLVRGFEQVLCDLFKSGFDVEWRCFYATQFGYNHRRERIYGVAYAQRLGWQNTLKNGGLLHKVLPQWAPRSIDLPMPTKRYDGDSINDSIRMHDGFPAELDKRRIHGCGNAVVVDIPQAIMAQLIQHWPQ